MLNLVGLQAKSNPATVRKILEALYAVILKQLELNGEICLDSFGTFKLLNVKANDRRMYDLHNDEMTVRYIAEHNKLVFEPSKKFKEAINDDFKPKLRARGTKKKKKKDYYEKVPAPTIEEVMVDALSISKKRSEGNNRGYIWS